MKRLYILTISILISLSAIASHIVGGEISITHISNYDYKLEMRLYRDASGIAAPPTAAIDVFQRQGVNNVGSFNLPLDSSGLLPPSVIGCGSPLLNIEGYYYSDVINLSPNTYNHPSGYLFTWTSCCRNSGVVNIVNSSGAGSSVITMFPPVVDGNGNQIINSSPNLVSPFSDFAVNEHPYYLNFGGTDPDGDSLRFVLYTPFEQGSPIAGTTTAISGNFPDPSTQFDLIDWENCYNVDNQINGFSNPSCTSLNEADRLKIDIANGELSMVSGEGNIPGYFLVGIWCQEFRNGELIGSVFRDFQLSIVENNLDPNSAPQVHVPQLQQLASWDADTMVFTGSPVCVQLGITDPDSIADIEIEAVYSDYDPGDLTFVQNYAVILNPDTFNTALCFQPDSFLPNTTEGQVVALNPGCYDLRGDTLPFYFRFEGYSNAGWGGIKNVPFTQGMDNFNLFDLLDYNPNPGGEWVDLDYSALIQPDGTFLAQNVTTYGNYRYLYIDEQPNYPPDTAYLEVRLVQPNALEELDFEHRLYPNPAGNSFNIHVSHVSQSPILKITDIQGREILKKEISEMDTQINTSDWAAGVYFYSISEQRGKLIIDK